MWEAELAIAAQPQPPLREHQHSPLGQLSAVRHVLEGGVGESDRRNEDDEGDKRLGDDLG